MDFVSFMVTLSAPLFILLGGQLFRLWLKVSDLEIEVEKLKRR